MSVYTTVDSAQLEQFLRRYDIGQFERFEPIAAGITNSNYRLDTDQGRYVLTLYEHHSDDELDYILKLQQYLAGRGVACAAPVSDRRGESYSTLNHRPTAIITRLDGAPMQQPVTRHCHDIGTELARLHLAGIDFPGQRPNPRGLDWIVAARDMLQEVLQTDETVLIDATLVDYRRLALEALPRGSIHADLFHDNALFDGDALCGIIDFDYACSDSFVLDIAVLLNDWCIDSAGNLDPTRAAAVIDAYHEIRPLSQLELDSLPTLLAMAALRFWLSRLYDQTFPLSGELTFTKCPATYRDLLKLRRDTAAELGHLFNR